MSELGILLQEARLNQELSIEELAQRTNIRPQFLQAMEAGDFGQLPGEAYVRPFLRTYAKALGLDLEQVMVEFEAQSLTAEDQLVNMREQRAKNRADKRKKSAFKILVFCLAIVGLGYALYHLFWMS